MAGSTHLTSRTSPVFIFLAIMAGRSTGVEVRIGVLLVSVTAVVAVVSTSSNGLAAAPVVVVVEGSFPSVENMYRGVEIFDDIDDIDDAVKAYEDDAIIIVMIIIVVAMKTRLHRVMIILYT